MITSSDFVGLRHEPRQHHLPLEHSVTPSSYNDLFYLCFLLTKKFLISKRLEKVPRDQGDCLDRRGTICHGGISSLKALGAFLEEVLTATLFPNK